MVSRKTRTIRLALAGLGLFAGFTQSTQAASRYWLKPASGTNYGGTYETTSRWTGAVIPGTADTTVFDLSQAYTVTFTGVGAAGKHTTSRLMIGNDFLTFDLGGGSMNAISPTSSYTSFAMGLVKGNDSRLSLRNGILVDNSAVLANVTGTKASVTIYAGATWQNAGPLTIGNAGTGNMTVYGGTVSSDSGRVGIYSGTTGNVYISGASKWNVAKDVSVGGSNSAGTLVSRWGGLLTVGGTLNVQKKGYLSLDNGTVTAGRLSSTGKVDFLAGTLNVTNSPILIGTGGPLGTSLTLSSTKTLNVTQTTTVGAGAKLILDGGKFASGTTNNLGEINLNDLLSQFGGGNLINNAGSLFHGRGQAVVSSVTNYGTISAVGTDQLNFTGGIANNGLISLSSGGSMGFAQDLANNTSGIIRGSGTLTVPGGISNEGLMSFTEGSAQIDSVVNNTPGGQIEVMGSVSVPATVASFLQPVTHNGDRFHVASGSTAIFSKNVSGAGDFTGTGNVQFERTYSPGNSPAQVSIEGAMNFGPNGNLVLELGPGGQTDQVNVGLDANLSAVNITAMPDFEPVYGETYTLVTASAISYNGPVTVTGLDAGSYILDQGETALTLTVIPEPTFTGLFLGAALLPMLGRRRRNRK